MERRGCLQSFIPFILILCLLLSLTACDVAAILDRLKNEVSGSENPTNDFSSGSMDESYVVDGDENTFITVTPAEGNRFVISDDGSITIDGEGDYTISDGYIISGDGTVIGKVEIINGEESFSWIEGELATDKATGN